jgi:hypothetical protein
MYVNITRCKENGHAGDECRRKILFERRIPLKISGTFGNIRNPTFNIQHRIKERLQRSILISVPVATFFLVKKMAFIIDRMAERSDIFIQRWTGRSLLFALACRLCP